MSRSDRFVITILSSGFGGIMFAAILGTVMDGYVEDAFQAVRGCAKNFAAPIHIHTTSTVVVTPGSGGGGRMERFSCGSGWTHTKLGGGACVKVVFP